MSGSRYEKGKYECGAVSRASAEENTLVFNDAPSQE